MDANCLSCRSNRLRKYGRTNAGKQKFRCKDCGRQFVWGADYFIEPETKDIVMGLLVAGVAPSKIKESVPDVSLRWIYYLRKQVEP